MREKLLALILILFPLIVWGQDNIINVNLSETPEGFTISDNNKTYCFTGTYSGTPEQKISDDRDPIKAVICIDKEVLETTIILDNVNISLREKQQCPLFAGNAKTVTLMLTGNNILSTTHYDGRSPGLWTPSGNDCKIIIQNKEDNTDGYLTAQGAKSYPGIGPNSMISQKSIITINSGIINAIGGEKGPGIKVVEKTILNILGGVITAKGGDDAAGIGGGLNGKGGTYTISGGTVTATKGMVMLTGGYNAAGIGYGHNYYAVTTKDVFSTGDNGNAFIITNSISDNADEKKKSWSGIIFEGDNNGKVYGSSIELTTDAVVPSGKTLEIESGKTLTINNGITLENKGTITNGGTITNNGKILNVDGGTISSTGTLNGNAAVNGYEITYNSNYDSGPANKTAYIESGADLPTDIFTRSYYTFKGWYKDADCNNNVDKVTENITVYAKWELNAFTVNTAARQELTYKQPISYDLSLLLSADAVKNCGTMTYEVTNNALPEGLSLDGSIIKGSPNTVNTNEVEVTITATAANTSTVDIPIAFTVAKKELVITPVANQSIYQDEVATYEPLFETNIRDDEEGMTYIGKLAWDMNNNITIGNLVFDNYEPTLSSSPVSITIEDSNIPVVITSIPNINDWCTDDITLTAPNGFKISGNDKTRTADWQPSITISEEGSYEYAYSLLRDKQTMPVNQTISVKLDKTAPNLSGTTNKLNYTLTFSDAGSGIDKLYIDGAEVTLASSATTYTATGTAGTHTAKVTDKAGLSQEFSFELVDGGSIDPDPVPEPDPEPVYYDVRLVETEGVVFSPAAGTYPVEEYGSFSFSVTVAEGYREQSVPVVKVNGNVFDPVDADGHYKIKLIRSDQSVTVEGILADNPTANENLSTPVFKLRTEGHTLCITVAQPRLCRLFDPSGRLICSRQLTLGINRLEGLAAGIYFVVVEREGVRKIVVQ